MPLAEQFKNSSFSNIAKDLVKKYKPERKINDETDEKQVFDSKGQNEILNIIEYERGQEKDKKKIREYDALIAFIKNFFAKKHEFDLKKALKTLQEKAKDEELCKRAMELLKKHPVLEQFAIRTLGENVVKTLKTSNAFSRKSVSAPVRSL